MYILFVFLLFPLTFLCGMSAIKYLWLWFITPFGLPPIGFAHAYGICLLVSLFQNHLDPELDERTDTQKINFHIARYCFLPLMFLLMGYITKLCME